NNNAHNTNHPSGHTTHNKHKSQKCVRTVTSVTPPLPRAPTRPTIASATPRRTMCSRVAHNHPHIMPTANKNSNLPRARQRGQHGYTATYVGQTQTSSNQTTINRHQAFTSFIAPAHNRPVSVIW